jgi:hypothetical protein
MAPLAPVTQTVFDMFMNYYVITEFGKSRSGVEVY